MAPVIKALALCVALSATSVLSSCNAQSNDSTAKSRTALEKPKSAAGLQQIPLTILSGSKSHEFTVELAETAAEQARGLMFRTELAPNAGMIFPFERERIASFWMKNTVIPLDIIFIRSDGTIESIAANTIPYSLEPVRSLEPVGAVLELAGGRASELSIRPGDKVRW